VAGETTHTAAELLKEPDDDEECSALEEAEAWLRDALASGPRLATEMVLTAKAAGIAERTLRRARKRLKIRAEKQGGSMEGKWWWVPPWPASPKVANHSEKVAKDAQGGQASRPLTLATFGVSRPPSGGTHEGTSDADDVEVF